MTQPSITNNSTVAKPEPDNPAVQAIDFALRLATARATGTVATIATIDDIMGWAETMKNFIKAK